MTRIGYTLMCEQSPPKQLIADAARAEAAGFDFEVMSDHYFPWLDAQGHSPNAWVTLGAIAQVTERVDLLTYVTCPIMRYHPAVVAQQAATLVVGRGWPPVNVRHEMLHEAVEIIHDLFTGDYVNYTGQHYRIDSAKLWDLGQTPPRIGIAISGEQSARLAGELADVMIAVEPEGRLTDLFDKHGGTGKPRVGQVPICWDPDKDRAIARAHEQFRWFAGGWKVNAELPGTAAFAAATQFVTKDDVAQNISCGPDLAAHVAAVKGFVEAGFTDVAVVQIGGATQAEFLDWAEHELIPALRD
jgi:alkanesulfonate monooxygenase SsuD/methylene tetrahydromethanopterin reductase-like flavin-dependent oxidoreductase (luciferase family)